MFDNIFEDVDKHSLLTIQDTIKFDNLSSTFQEWESLFNLLLDFKDITSMKKYFEFNSNAFIDSYSVIVEYLDKEYNVEFKRNDIEMDLIVSKVNENDLYLQTFKLDRTRIKDWFIKSATERRILIESFRQMEFNKGV